jgi:hypothetical protein
MPDALETEDAEDRKRREKVAGRVGRHVEGVAPVRPATRDGWASWAAAAGCCGGNDYATILTGTVAIAATLSGQERRRARAKGLATHMALAVTEHEAHLFRTRAMGRIVGDHVMTVPYGMVTKVTLGRKASAWTGAELVKVTIEVADGSKFKLTGDAAHRQVFEQLQARAAAVPVGTVPPAPEQRPEPSVARVLASAAGHVAKGTVRVSGHVRAAR